ncbi:MAG: hypothetical protein CM15mP117_05000 [Alphaproteobacteria bacterium]|nr:MAG: hypothetical protein CM15mP117_05000 [Alphaproteobacteria bacterium]
MPEKAGKRFWFTLKPDEIGPILKREEITKNFILILLELGGYNTAIAAEVNINLEILIFKFCVNLVWTSTCFNCSLFCLSLSK